MLFQNGPDHQEGTYVHNEETWASFTKRSRHWKKQQNKKASIHATDEEQAAAASENTLQTFIDCMESMYNMHIMHQLFRPEIQKVKYHVLLCVYTYIHVADFLF